MRQVTKPSTAAGIAVEGFASNPNKFHAEPSTTTESRAIKITNRPVITLPSQPCPNCSQAFIAAWGWIVLPDGQVLDLGGCCARRWRRCSNEQRRLEVSALIARLSRKEVAR